MVDILARLWYLAGSRLDREERVRPRAVLEKDSCRSLWLSLVHPEL